MGNRVGTLLACALLLGTLTGCASLFKGDMETVYFRSDPEGARVLIDGEEMGKTPTLIALFSERSHQVDFRLPGYRTSSVRINSRLGWGWFILDLPTYFVGVIVDAITGDWYTLDMHEVSVSLEKSREEPGAGDTTETTGEP